MDCRVIWAKTRFALFSGNDELNPMPARLFLSSGDLVADRRYDFARDLQLRGDLPAAADLLRQAIELAPKFASAWFTLGKNRHSSSAPSISAAARVWPPPPLPRRSTISSASTCRRA